MMLISIHFQQVSKFLCIVKYIKIWTIILHNFIKFISTTKVTFFSTSSHIQFYNKSRSYYMVLFIECLSLAEFLNCVLRLLETCFAHTKKRNGYIHIATLPKEYYNNKKYVFLRKCMSVQCCNEVNVAN